MPFCKWFDAWLRQKMCFYCECFVLVFCSLRKVLSQALSLVLLLSDVAAQSDRCNVWVRASARSLFPTHDQHIRVDKEERAVLLPYASSTKA